MRGDRTRKLKTGLDDRVHVHVRLDEHEARMVEEAAYPLPVATWIRYVAVHEARAAIRRGAAPRGGETPLPDGPRVDKQPQFDSNTWEGVKLEMLEEDPCPNSS